MIDLNDKYTPTACEESFFNDKWVVVNATNLESINTRSRRSEKM